MLEVTCVVDRSGVYKLAHGENLYVKTCNDELPNVRVYTSEMVEKPYVYETLLDACPYSGYFRVVTQPHHEYGYGLSVWIAVEAFTDWEPLLFALLDVMEFFRSSVEVLMVSGEIGKILPFSENKQQAKEAA